VSAQPTPRTDAVSEHHMEPDEILRFRASERHMHWAVAIPFMGCYLTAAVLMLAYSSNPQRALHDVFWWSHRVSGLGLILLPAWAMLRHWYDIALHMRNTKEAWRWTRDDFRWLFLMGPSTIIRSIELPEQGKFNAAEKINFMVLTATTPLYIVTGLLLWTHQFAFPAWVLHLTMAAAATPLLLGHIYMAVVNPDTRVGLSGMITGMVSRHWASHHYGRWYKETFPHLHVPHVPHVPSMPQMPRVPQAPRVPRLPALPVVVELSAHRPEPLGQLVAAAAVEAVAAAVPYQSAQR